MKRFIERIKISIIKNPGRAVLIAIFFLNIVILLTSSFIIYLLMKDSLGDIGYYKTVYYTICMMLDAGCIDNLVTDVGKVSIALILFCILTIILGMITFTGAAIGYVTNYISSFIENANSDSKSISVSGHIVILNWNNRAAEIVNDMLYLKRREVIIILSNKNKEEIENELDDYKYLTLSKEKRLRDKLKIIVRKGNIFSSKQLNDISISKAKTVIILADDKRIDTEKNKDEYVHDMGDSKTIKTLIQVAEITASDSSNDNQRIIVEVEDEWTANIVERIIAHKEIIGKNNIVAVHVNKILGQLLSQICIFPELNNTYSRLLSNDGASFYNTYINENKVKGREAETKFIENVLYLNNDLIPLSFMKSKTGRFLYYMSKSEGSFRNEEREKKNDLQVELNSDYWIEHKNVIIIGHNSKIKSIMDGFDHFRAEWNRQGHKDVLSILVIDDKTNLMKNNYYKDYSYVENTVEVDFYDIDKIKKTIEEFIDSHEEDTSVLILSDDTVQEEDIDTFVLTNLIYIQDLIYYKSHIDPLFNKEKIDIIVEILNPKNYDVVLNYDVSNIVISNRYISKMITQMSERIELFEFYEDIFTYDESNAIEYNSKEIYVKKVKEFMTKLPNKCKILDLIRAIYDASPQNNKAIVIGLVKHDEGVKLFEEKLIEEISLHEEDKLIIYSNH